jgi:hypothetical protein
MIVDGEHGLRGEKVDTEREKMALVEKSKGREVVAIGLRRQGGERIGNTNPRLIVRHEKPQTSYLLRFRHLPLRFQPHRKYPFICPIQQLSITILTSSTIIPETLFPIRKINRYAAGESVLTSS